MGIPVGVDVRDDGVDPAALDRAFAHLRDADDAFSPYRAASDVRRLDAGTLAPPTRGPRSAPCSTAASACAARPAGGSTSARPAGSTRRAS